MRTENVSLGLWVDLPKRMVLDQLFFDWFSKDLKFDMMAVMIDQADEAVEFSWSPSDVEKLLKFADKDAVEIGLTTWPYPNKDLLKQMKIKMTELMKVGPIAEWETDQEFNWKEDQVEGFRGVRKQYSDIQVTRLTPYEVASNYLTNIKKEVCAIQGARNAITTFTHHRENSARAAVTQSCDLMMVQAYSVCSRNGRSIPFHHRYGPGRMQGFTLNRSVKIPGIDNGSVKLGIGHAAWKQTEFKDNDGELVSSNIAMRTAYETALNYPTPVIDHRWWSAKFCYPMSRRYNGYSTQFLQSLRD